MREDVADRLESAHPRVEALTGIFRATMSEWGVESEDVYGTIALINFAEPTLKIALTHDFTTWHPIDRIE